MTERPEEQDSLERVEPYRVGYVVKLRARIAALEAEVKERDEALRKIRDRDLEWDDEEGMIAVAEGVIGSKDRPE